MITSLPVDYLIRLKNASLAGNKTVEVVNSKFIRNISEVLKKNGFISDFEISEDQRSLTVHLVYTNRIPKITEVKIFSKPGRRWYERNLSLPWGQTPDSLIIVSTSKGVLTQKQAKSAGIGGEIIAEIL